MQRGDNERQPVPLEAPTHDNHPKCCNDLRRKLRESRGDIATVLEWLRLIMFRTEYMIHGPQGPEQLYMLFRYGVWIHATLRDICGCMWGSTWVDAEKMSVTRIIRENLDAFPAKQYVIIPDDRVSPNRDPRVAVRNQHVIAVAYPRVRHARLLDYGPYECVGPYNVFSSYEGFNKDNDCDLDLVREHVLYSWCAGDAALCEWLLDWIACAAFSGRCLGAHVVIRGVGPDDDLAGVIRTTFEVKYGCTFGHGVACGSDKYGAARMFRNHLFVPWTLGTKLTPGTTRTLAETGRTSIGDMLANGIVHMVISYGQGAYDLPCHTNVLGFVGPDERLSRNLVPGTIVLDGVSCFAGDKQQRFGDPRCGNLADYILQRWRALCEREGDPVPRIARGPAARTNRT